jgi:hypothetical protein
MTTSMHMDDAHSEGNAGQVQVSFSESLSLGQVASPFIVTLKSAKATAGQLGSPGIPSIISTAAMTSIALSGTAVFRGSNNKPTGAAL